MLTERHWGFSMQLSALPTTEKTETLGEFSCFLGTEMNRQQEG